MNGWSRFLDAFFKPNLIAQELPSILQGMVVTIEIAVAVVVAVAVAVGVGDGAPWQVKISIEAIGTPATT